MFIIKVFVLLSAISVAAVSSAESLTFLNCKSQKTAAVAKYLIVGPIEKSKEYVVYKAPKSKALRFSCKNVRKSANLTPKFSLTHVCRNLDQSVEMANGPIITFEVYSNVNWQSRALLKSYVALPWPATVIDALDCQLAISK